MKINFMFSNKDGKVELFNFTENDEILIFFTNPFKLGFGWKRREVQGTNITFTSYRFSSRHFKFSPFGFTNKDTIQGAY